MRTRHQCPLIKSLDTVSNERQIRLFFEINQPLLFFFIWIYVPGDLILFVSTHRVITLYIYISGEPGMMHDYNILYYNIMNILLL